MNNDRANGGRDIALGSDDGDSVGSLVPGKRADTIAVRIDALNTAPVGSPDFMLTHSAQPAIVDFVAIDGVVHEQDGRMLQVDVLQLLAEARQTIAALRQQAGI